MKKIFLFLLLFINAGFLPAQNGTITLASAKTEIDYILPQATLQFSKADFLADFNMFKREVGHRISREDSAAYEQAIKFLKLSNGKVTVHADVQEKKPELEVLKKLIKIRIGANLLNFGKASVVSKGGQSEKTIAYHEVMGSEFGPSYVYSFSDHTDFFSGEVYGAPTAAAIDQPIEEPIPAESTPNVVADENQIFTVIEISPAPAGGMANYMVNYITPNLKYTKAARKAKVEGVVFVEFTVEKDGSLTGAKSIKGLGYGLDEEAVRVISESPQWKPGKQNGKTVSTRFVLPVRFKLP